MKKTLALLLTLTMFVSAFSVYPFNTVSAQEEQPVSDTELLLPEAEDIYEGTGSLAYAFDDSFIRDYVDNEQLDEAGHVARIHDEEGLDTYVFLNRDGTKSVYYMDDNVRYVDENGERVEKDLTLVRKNKGYSLKASDVKLWFPDVVSDGISVKYDNFHLTLYPQGIADTEEAVIDEYDRITYPGVFGENTVLAYTPTLSGLKEDIIVTEYTGQLSYDFLIHTHGMRILEQDGKWVAKKPGNGNKETFELGAVQIYDSAGNFCVGEMTVTAQNNGSKYILTLTAPEEFMTDPDTVYPVTIDPTIEVSDNVTGSGAIEDSVIYSGTPDANYGGFTYLTVGYNGSTYGIGRALFRLPGLYNSTAYTSVAASQILSVYFYAWDASGHDSAQVDLRVAVTSGWTESGVTWNNAPTFTEQFNFGTSMPSNEYACFDITSLAKWWKSGMYLKEAGFMLVNPDETSETYKKVPCSSETSVTTRRPYVVMTYTTGISITPSANSIPAGNTLQLAISSDVEYQSVTWSSNNTTVATVSETGLLYAANVGRAVVTATVTLTDGKTYTVPKDVYTVYPTSVCRIANKSSGRYLNVNEGMINSFAQVTQYSSTANEDTLQEQFQQLWKINYIGDGLYTLRPYHKLDMCLYSYGANDYAFIRQTAASDANVIGVYQWSIEWLNGGYVIKRSGDSAKTLQIEDGSNAQSARARTESYVSTATTCHWVFSQIESPGTGILLYDTATQKQINASDVTLYIAPEETKTLSNFGICAALYSPTSITQTFNWSIIRSEATCTASGTVTGVKYTNENSINLTVKSTVSSSYTASVKLYVTAIPNGTYYVQNKGSSKYMDVSGSTSVETNFYDTEKEWVDVSDGQKWTFTHLGDGYYSIQSAYDTTSYLRVNNDASASGSAIGISSTSSTNGAKWKVKKLTNGAFTFSPKSASSTMVATDVSNSIKLQSYTNNADYQDEWELYNLVISVVNYYDSSFSSDLVNNIAAANAFVEDVFYEVFGLSIKMDGAATLLESLPANECSASGHCDGSCGTGYHCKDIVRNSDSLYNSNRENNHIYVMWTNRGGSSYCATLQDADETSPEHDYCTNVLASVHNYRPVILVYDIPDGAEDDPQKAMSMILAHEIAHSLGLMEMYKFASHGNDPYDCIMDEWVSTAKSEYNYKGLFNDISSYLNANSGIAPFCEDCIAGIKEKLRENQPIKGN